MVTTNTSGLYNAILQTFNTIGTALIFRYYNFTIGGAGSYYDDDVSFSLSGTAYTSGLMQTIGNNGVDAFLKEQGKILEDDTKFYILGNVQTSGLIKIGIGSPSVREYSLINPGTIAHKFGDDATYKICYGRWLPNGSLT